MPNPENSNRSIKNGIRISSFHVKKMGVYVALYTLMNLADPAVSDYRGIACHKTTASEQFTCTIASLFRTLAGQESSVGIWKAAQEKLGS